MYKEYARNDAVEYAYKWAFSRNPQYYNYDNIGGDCTNFISQCLYKGSKIMNHTKVFGWYYNNANDKAPAWTGVEYLYKYLNRQKETLGPIGKEVSKEDLELGDIIQLSFDGNRFSHSLIVTNKKNTDIFVSTHSKDSLNRNLKLYNFKQARFIHINNIVY